MTNHYYFALFSVFFSACGTSCGPYKPVPDAGSGVVDASNDVATDVTSGGCIPNSQTCSLGTTCCTTGSTCNSSTSRCQACLVIDDFCSDNIDCCSGICNGGACQ
jgi:hypothetical protein